MRILWTLLKVIIGLALAIPLGIVALAVTLGVLGSLVALALLVLKLAAVGFVGYGLFRIARRLFASKPRPAREPVRQLPAPDPYYQAAMRELDREMGFPSAR